MDKKITFFKELIAFIKGRKKELNLYELGSSTEKKPKWKAKTDIYGIFTAADNEKIEFVVEFKTKRPIQITLPSRIFCTENQLFNLTFLSTSNVIFFESNLEESFPSKPEEIGNKIVLFLNKFEELCQQVKKQEEEIEKRINQVVEELDFKIPELQKKK